MQSKLLCVFLLFSYFGFAQQVNLTGTVKDKGQSLPGASVSVLNIDSSFVTGAITDTSGVFSFSNIPPGNYILKISFLGYEDLFKNITSTTALLNLGNLALIDKASLLNAVDVNAQVLPVQQKGDTTQYNADAYKTNKDANAEDLVTKMPGVTIQDGKVQAQGEEVKKVLIDGKPYLGDDPNAALKNLPAEVIDKIQVFDKKSDQAEFTGFDDGNSSKTINIVTRPQFRNGTFGKVYGGYGTDELWKSGLNINSFKDKRKFTILGNANNINEQNFSTDDLLGVVGTSSNRTQLQRGNFGQRSGGGGGYGGRNQSSDAGNFLVDQKNGLTTTYSAGINYANSWKKFDLSGSYFFNHTINKSNNNLERHYTTTGSEDLIYTENNIGRAENYNHRANLKLEYKFDSLNSILLQPRISIQNNNSTGSFYGKNTNSEGTLSDIVNLSTSVQDGYSLSAPLLYRHSFLKKGRTISLNVNPSLNDNVGNSTFKSTTFYPLDSIPADTLNQNVENNGDGLNVSSELNYTEPISKASQLSLSYKTNYNKSNSGKKTYTYSPLDEQYNTLDTSLSNEFTSVYFSQAPGLNYRWQNEKWNFMLGANYQFAKLNNESAFPVSDSIERTFTSVLPGAMFQYKFTPKKSVRLFYRTNNNAPTVTQLQNVLNNNNPLQLSIGNPTLDQDWQNNLNIRYSAVNTDKNTSFFVFANSSITKDYIGNSTYISDEDSTTVDGILLTNGAQLTRPENFDGYYSFRTFSNYSFPFKSIKSTINLNANAGYTRTPSKINNEINSSKNFNSGLGFSVSSNISEKFDFLVSANGNITSIRNSIQESSNSDYFNLTTKFKINVMPWKGIVITTDFNHQRNSGLSSSYDQDYILWNAAIGYKFLKNQVAELRLSVFDILNQNKSISRNTYDTYYEDVQSYVLQQYFMLTFTYNLKFFKVVKE